MTGSGASEGIEMGCPYLPEGVSQNDIDRYYGADEPEEEEFDGTLECLKECFEAHEHVMGCPHGPDCDIPYDWEPDFNAGEAADMKYRSDLLDAGRGHLLR